MLFLGLRWSAPQIQWAVLIYLEVYGMYMYVHGMYMYMYVTINAGLYTITIVIIFENCYLDLSL